MVPLVLENAHIVRLCLMHLSDLAKAAKAQSCRESQDSGSLKSFRVEGPPEVDRIRLWVYPNKIPIYPIFYLLKGDYRPNGRRVCYLREP